MLLLWSVKTLPFGMSGETNSSTLSISRTRSKCCNPQNMMHMYILFCSTLEYHTLLHKEVMPSLVVILLKWCSYTSLVTLSPSCSCLGMLGCERWCGHPMFLTILIALKSNDICVILSWLVNRSLSEVWPCCQVRCSGAHSSVKELGSFQSS